MTRPLVAVGMTVETQTVGSPVGPWVPLENVQSISGGDITLDFTEITGKTDTVVQRVPNKISPGTITFTILFSAANATTELQRWRNAIQFKGQFNVRVSCGVEAPTAYWLTFNAAYIAGYTLPQLGSTGTVTYTLTFQLTS